MWSLALSSLPPPPPFVPLQSLLQKTIRIFQKGHSDYSVSVPKFFQLIATAMEDACFLCCCCCLFEVEWMDPEFPSAFPPLMPLHGTKSIYL